MAVNLSKHGSELSDVYNEVVRGNTGTDWVLYTYEGNSYDIQKEEETCRQQEREKAEEERQRVEKERKEQEEREMAERARRQRERDKQINQQR
ncbi:drebrin-like protein isoform X3 [Silurus asotus]|uniref:Drebrin-like protein isoform X3 n=1 Tax=Silurus asotus TaxID=30991 RepID=A0AAD5AQV5_SILAS|nr:drebrin-like protein isoform X3 [Silurus asotus]